MEAREVGHNLMTLEIRHPIAREASYDKAKSENGQVIDGLLENMNRFQPKDKKATVMQQENLIEAESQTLRTITEIKFPNRGRLLEAALDHLAGEMTRRDGKPLTAVIRPTAAQNDFNDVLQNRNGKPLPDSSNLSLNKVPLPSFQTQKETLPMKKEEKQQYRSIESNETPVKRKVRL